MFKKTIFTGFAPNATGRDVLVALSFLLLPWRWPKMLKGQAVKKAEEKLKDYFKVKYSFTFDSGRSALYFALKALGVGLPAGEAGESDEILIQTYTCVVVVNAIKQTGATPVFIDVDDRFNMSPEDLERKITGRAKVLIVQHTFGSPAPLAELLEIAKKHDLKVVEDCAHSLGLRYNNQLTGTFGDIGMLSFGSDKIISCMRGGALITNNDELAGQIKSLQDGLRPASLVKTIQHLSHHPIFYFCKPLYGWFIGKALLALARKFNAVNRIVYQPEKEGREVSAYPSQLANSLAEILLNQLGEIDEVNEHRWQIAGIYDRLIKNENIKLPLAKKYLGDLDCVYLRYPVLVKQPEKLHQFAKKRGIILGDWYDSIIAPRDIDLEQTGYQKGSCPKAELLASQSVNLPTNRQITVDDAKRVAKVINDFKL